jgi:hypothetical protein
LKIAESSSFSRIYLSDNFIFLNEILKLEGTRLDNGIDAGSVYVVVTRYVAIEMWTFFLP